MTSQDRKTETLTAIQASFPRAHVREFSFGFRVFLVPKDSCANNILENSPVSFSIDFIEGSDDLKIKTSLSVRPENKMFFCDNAAKKHRLNLTLKASQSFNTYVQKLKKALSEENTNIIHNEESQLQTFFI